MNPISLPHSFSMVFFGGTGDLVTRKLLPAMYQAHKHGLLVEKGHILCLGLEDWDQETFLQFASGKAREFIHTEDWIEDTWSKFSARLSYLRLDATHPDDYQALLEIINTHNTEINVFYLSTASFLFTPICENLAALGLNDSHNRIVLEKPLGHDLNSSNAITDSVGQYFHERQTYRIDHYLGKESVQNLMALRFGNSLFEPLWRREWISNIQITISEEVGIGSRAGFYDKAGALRDMVQNHLLQLLCFVAMEPPTSLKSDAIRDEKLKVLESLIEFSPEDVHTNTVRGQYKAGISGGCSVQGYLDENDIPSGSTTETFVAIKAQIANWRWAGVPFFLRTGKRMPDRFAEIVVYFRDVPHPIFPVTPGMAQGASRLEIRLQPDEYIRLYFNAKPPGDSMQLQQVYLDLNFAEQFKTRNTEGGYERLLLDIIRGNQALFVRQDELERAWRWVEPILNTWANDRNGPRPYSSGTWGPSTAATLLSREGFSWHEDH